MLVPSIAIVVYPYMYATALARLFEALGHEVTAHDVMTEDWDEHRPYDVLLASLPVPRGAEHVRIDLPGDYAKPIRVAVGAVIVDLTMDGRRPVEHLVEFVDRLARNPRVATADAVRDLARS